MYSVAFGILILPALVIIIMNARGLLRQRTNKLCAVAIVLCMLSLIVNVLANFASGASHVPRNTIDGMLLAKLGLDVLAILLAIVGIVQRSLSKRRRKGMGRAFAAILISGSYTGFAAYSISVGVSEGLAWQQSLRPLETRGQPIIREQWNFRMTTPPSWNQVDAAAFPGAQVALRREKPDLFCVIVAEELPEGSKITLADYMDLQKKLVRESTRGAQFSAEEEMPDRGYSARTMEARGNELINPQFQVFWVLREGNIMYRITTWGSTSLAKEVREEASKILHGFDLIERRGKPKPSAPPTLALQPRPHPGDRSLL